MAPGLVTGGLIAGGLIAGARALIWPVSGLIAVPAVVLGAGGLPPVTIDGLTAARGRVTGTVGMVRSGMVTSGRVIPGIRSLVATPPDVVGEVDADRPLVDADRSALDAAVVGEAVGVGQFVTAPFSSP